MEKTIKTTLTGATRMGTSVLGNPYFMLHTTDGDFRTQINSSVVYELSGLVRGIPPLKMRVVLSLTKSGRVYSIEGTV